MSLRGREEYLRLPRQAGADAESRREADRARADGFRALYRRDGAYRACHSEANLSDSLTKATAYGPIELYMRTGCWVLVHDEEQLSAKKRKDRGLTRFETNKKDFAGLIRDALKNAEISLPDAADGGEDDDRDQVCSGPPDRNF